MKLLLILVCSLSGVLGTFAEEQDFKVAEGQASACIKACLPVVVGRHSTPGKKMNLSLAAAKMILGQLASKDLVDIAVQALIDGSDSPSFAVLAGETDPIWSEAIPLFEGGLRESGLIFPSKHESIWILLMHLLSLIASGEIDCYEGMIMIDNAICSNLPNDLENTRHVGDGLGIEHCYTWYRELQDAEDGSMLLYHSDLPRGEAIAKFRGHLVEEAKNALQRIQTEYAAAASRSAASSLDVESCALPPHR